MFTMKGCSLIRGVHYERFHCTVNVVTEVPLYNNMFLAFFILQLQYDIYISTQCSA